MRLRGSEPELPKVYRDHIGGIKGFWVLGTYLTLYLDGTSKSCLFFEDGSLYGAFVGFHASLGICRPPPLLSACQQVASA